MRRHDRGRRRRRLDREGSRSLRRRRPVGYAAAQVEHRRRMDGEQRAQLRRRLIIHVLVDDRAAACDDHLLGRRCRRDDADVGVRQEARCPTRILKAPFPW